MRKICDTKQYPSGTYLVREIIAYLDVNVRMGVYINYLQNESYITDHIDAIYGHSMEMRPKRRHTIKTGYGGVTNATLRSNNQLLQQQQHAHRVAGCC